MEEEFKGVQVGDKLIRMLGGAIPITVMVSKVDNEIITCTIPPEDYGRARTGINKTAEKLRIPLSEEEKEDMPTWTFSIRNGAEIDPALGWNEQYTGSYLVKPEKI